MISIDSGKTTVVALSSHNLRRRSLAFRECSARASCYFIRILTIIVYHDLNNDQYTRAFTSTHENTYMSKQRKLVGCSYSERRMDFNNIGTIVLIENEVSIA